MLFIWIILLAERAGNVLQSLRRLVSCPLVTWANDFFAERSAFSLNFSLAFFKASGLSLGGSGGGTLEILAWASFEVLGWGGLTRVSWGVFLNWAETLSLNEVLSEVWSLSH